MTINDLTKNKLLVTVFCFFTVSTCYALPSNDFPNDKTVNNSMTKSNESVKQLSDFEKQIASKMALDIRHFCPEKMNGDTKPSNRCLQPVTKLPAALADVVTTSGVGSVVLFAENLVSTEQVIQLTHDLQQAALKSTSGQALIISVDQEGGRVVRFPHATSFAGNMAIGATYPEHGVKFSAQSSDIIAKELHALGINNNYAPVVDVNTNPNNPVINTRSYGENPQQVAELGAAAVKGFQQQGIMATLKHFPGHGDTHVDSHLGLPIVEHDLAKITKQDLAPFQWAIQHSDPAMIMTAHIQYPALDDSTIENINGDPIIRPATMSRVILTDLLRKKMGYEGIIATDALDMAGVAHYFDPVTAVVETFVAGADIAVMPFKIKYIEDVEPFYLFIKSVAHALQQKIQNNEFSMTEFNQSLARIDRYKEKYISLDKKTVSKKNKLAQGVIAAQQHLALEQALADNAVVLLNNKKQLLPIDTAKVKRIHLFVLNWQEFSTLKHAINDQWQKSGQASPQVSATVVSEYDANSLLESVEKLAKADLVIATVDTKIASLVDIGGAEDLLIQQAAIKAKNKVSYEQLLSAHLHQAKQQQITRILIAKGSPYLLQPYTELVSAILVTFDDRILQGLNNQVYSPGYNTSIAIVVGEQKALGTLPVHLKAQ